MEISWANGGDHGSLGVPPQALLQKPGEGGVSVRNVQLVSLPSGAVGQQGNDLPQGMQ